MFNLLNLERFVKNCVNDFVLIDFFDQGVSKPDNITDHSETDKTESAGTRKR